MLFPALPARPLDGVERRIGFRKLTGYPLYVMAGVARSPVLHQWLSYLSSHLIFGLPSTAFLFGGLWLCLRRPVPRRNSAGGPRPSRRLNIRWPRATGLT